MLKREHHFESEAMKRMCGGGRCPRVFETPTGSFIVQGIRVEGSLREWLNTLPGEEAVELPADLVAELKRALVT